MFTKKTTQHKEPRSHHKPKEEPEKIAAPPPPPPPEPEHVPPVTEADQELMQREVMWQKAQRKHEKYHAA